MSLRNRKEFWPAVGVLALGIICFFGSMAWAESVGPAQHLVAVDPVVVPPDWLVSLLVFLQQVPYVGPVIVFVGKWGAVFSVVSTALATLLVSVEKGLDSVSGLNPHLQWMGKISDLLGVITPWLKWASLLNHPEPWNQVSGVAPGQVPSP